MSISTFEKHSLKRICEAVSSRILIILIVFTISSVSLGYGFHDALTYGNSINVISIRSAAMVGIKVFGAEGGSAVFLNPAMLSNVNSVNITASTSSLAWTEEVVDSTSITQRSDRGIGSLTGAIAFRTGPDLVFAAGVAKVSDHQYVGTHFLPDDPSHPGIDVLEILSAKGGLWEALAGKGRSGQLNREFR